MTHTTQRFSFGATLCQLLLGGAEGQRPQGSDLPVDLSVLLAHEVGRLGTVQPTGGGFRIITDKPLVFPFGQILSILASRKFNVRVTRHDNGLVIDAQP